MVLQHDPADRATCDICGIAEDIHLLDGMLDAQERETGKFACIRCYPAPGEWAPTAESFIAVSIAPELAPLYAAYVKRRRILSAHDRLTRIRAQITALRLARNELRNLGCDTPANFVARALNALDAETREAQDSITRLEAS